MTRIAALICVLLIIMPAAALALQAPIDATTYPLTVSDARGRVLVHHPVIDDWRDFKLLSGRTPDGREFAPGPL